MRSYQRATHCEYADGRIAEGYGALVGGRGSAAESVRGVEAGELAAPDAAPAAWHHAVRHVGGHLVGPSAPPVHAPAGLLAQRGAASLEAVIRRSQIPVSFYAPSMCISGMPPLRVSTRLRGFV